MVSVILRKPKSHWISDKMCKELKKVSMKRFLLVVLSIALLSCSQNDQPVSSLEPIGGSFYEWKMITSWPKNLPALGTSPEYFAEIVETMSNGRMKIRVYGANELVGGLEVFDAVSQGVAEIGHSGAYYWQGKIPGTPFFSSIPFGMTSYEQDAWLRYGGGNELWRELYEPFNLIPVRGGNSGVQMFGWFNKEINSLEDLQGLTMRIPSLGGEVFRRAGGVPVTMQVSEVFTALQTGALDATEFVSPYNDLAAGYHTVAEYYYYPGWHEPGTCLEAFINLKYWNLLSNDLKRLVEACCIKSNSLIASEFFARNSFAIKKLKDDYNVDFVKYPDDLLKSLRKKSFEVVSDYARKDEMGKKIFDNIMKFRKLYMFWSEYSEKSFLESRI